MKAPKDQAVREQSWAPSPSPSRVFRSEAGKPPVNADVDSSDAEVCRLARSQSSRPQNPRRFPRHPRCLQTYLLHGIRRASSPSVLRKRAPVELEESDSESQVSSPHDVAVASAGGREDDDDDSADAANNSAGEEEETVDLFDAGGAEPKAKEDARGWHELREQIKSDLEMAHKQNSPITRIN
jgi:hypothetical protein